MWLYSGNWNFSKSKQIRMNLILTLCWDMPVENNIFKIILLGISGGGPMWEATKYTPFEIQSSCTAFWYWFCVYKMILHRKKSKKKKTEFHILNPNLSGIWPNLDPNLIQNVWSWILQYFEPRGLVVKCSLFWSPPKDFKISCKSNLTKHVPLQLFSWVKSLPPPPTFGWGQDPLSPPQLWVGVGGNVKNGVLLQPSPPTHTHPKLIVGGKLSVKNKQTENILLF